MISSGQDFYSIVDLVDNYFSLTKFPHVEERFLNHPKRSGNYPGKRNEHGFRADSFKDYGDINVVSIGCSWVEGHGVPYDNMFTEQLKSKLEKKTGFQISNWNLGLGGMGMDYIVRNAPLICSQLRPHFCIVLCTMPNRREYFSRDGRRLAFTKALPNQVRKGEYIIDENDQKLVDSYESLQSEFQDIAILINSLRSVDAIFKSHSIPWFYSWTDKSRLSESMEYLIENNVIPSQNFLGFKFERIDFASDINNHPGIKSHKKFADNLFEYIADFGLMSPTKSKKIIDNKKNESERTRFQTNSIKSFFKRVFKSKKYSSKRPDENDEIYPLW